MDVRVLIVDDEPLARRGVEVRLAGVSGMTVVGQAGSGREALQLIHSLRPDLIILDVQMPGMSGFEVLSALPADACPAVIFLTAFDEHAVEAFRVHALDYILKPIDNDRFTEAVTRAATSLASGSSQPLPLIIRDGADRHLVPLSEIDFMEAAGDYIEVHAGPDCYLVRETMARMERRLPDTFVRIHRSYIVAQDRVRRLSARPGGDFDVELQGGHSVRMSRTYRDRLPGLLAD